MISSPSEVLSSVTRGYAWWYSFRPTDFSWDGLSKQKIKGLAVNETGQLVPGEQAPLGSTPATLQDYWRDLDGSLVPELCRDGSTRLWTRLHLPITFENGKESGKRGWSDAEWAEIAKIIKRKLIAAASASSSPSLDSRAQLQGLVVRGLEAIGERLNINAEQAWFLDSIDFSGHSFAPGANFAGSHFFGDAIWSKTTLEDADFNNAEFAGKVSFAHAQLKGRTSFTATKFLGQQPSFAEAEFDSVSFYGATFDNLAFFRKAKFRVGEFGAACFNGGLGYTGVSASERLDFEGASFGRQNGRGTEIEFIETSFPQATSFKSANFWSETIFTSSKFEETIAPFHVSIKQLRRFEKSSFEQGVCFDSSTFHDQVFFQDVEFKVMCSFQGARFLANSFFSKAHFYKWAMFERADFPNAGSEVNFENAWFAEAAFFTKCTFQAQVRFHGARFSSRINFDRADFRGVRSLSFESSSFEGAASFASVEWPTSYSVHSHCFTDVTFPRLADFSGGSFRWFAMFDGTRFNGEVRLSRSIFNGDREFITALEAAKGNQDHLLALENGCRALKSAADTFKDKLSEQIFYRYELTSRRKLQSTASSERVWSYLYDRVSVCGTDTFRPLWVLFAVWICFAIVYWCVSFLFGMYPTAGITLKLFAPLHQSVFDTARLSAHVIFAPFSIWGGNFGVTPFDEALLKSGPGISLLVRWLASLESALAAVLLTLWVVAMKRRFQIN